ncbi:aldo/keto reductase [Pseudactinotalea sp. Z1748]|uniref:aldo/keto reductase n=1 Tax=Pseudactinotalea sp. Z1748 TaxID=3413027 RepID=UPI003C7C4D1D
MSEITMKYRQLGPSGLTVSVVGLGCNSFGVTVPTERVTDVVRAALDAGITFFDVSDTYGSTAGESEELLGKALGSRRADAVVATKFGMDTGGLNGPDWGVRGSRRYIRKAVEGSLRRLGTDHIDLYQMHRPDPHTPVAETLAALHELVAEGKVRYLGSSNFTGWQIIDADWTAHTAATTPFVSAQNEYNLLSRGLEAEVIPALEHIGGGLLPFFPLASGLLTGKYRRGQDAPEGTRLARRPDRLAGADFDMIEALQHFAEERDLSMLQVAIGWLAAKPGVASVISGASRPEQVRSNAAALWHPEPDDLAELDRITDPAT